MKKRSDRYDEDDLLFHPDLEDEREEADADVRYFLVESALGLDTSQFVRRFRRDKLYRRMVAPGIASDTEFDPPPSTFSKRERIRDGEAMDDECMAIEDAFTTRRPTAEQLRIRELRWAFVMKKYGLPAVDFATWELL